MKRKNRFNKTMAFQFTMTAFVALMIAFVLLVGAFLIYINVLDWSIEVPEKGPKPISPIRTLVFTVLISFIVGTAITVYLSKIVIRPLSELKTLTAEVARGNFEVKIKTDDIPKNEFGEFFEDFNTMVTELKKNEMLKSDFISNVSHEFKTPLSIIQGYATLLQDENISEEDRVKYSQTIFEATEKLTILVNDILKISKIDNRKVTIETSTYQLDEQIRECILSFEELWSDKEIDLNIEMEEITINADKNLLSNVWNNLINNAIKFSNPGGKIDINLTSKDENVIFKIKDYGCGIKQEDIPYIFDKFYQADKSHASKGNGLGLSLAKKIIELSSGSIEVKSTISEGSEFIVTIPQKLNKNLT